MKKFYSLLLFASAFSLSFAQNRPLTNVALSGVSYAGSVRTSTMGRPAIYDKYFQRSLDIIASQRFEDNRLQVAKQTAGSFIVV